MRQIREGVFETNSSSCHSVSVKRRKDMRCDWQLTVSGDGYIHIPLDSFGWNYDGDLYGQERRLSYILTMAAMNRDCTNYWDGDSSNEYNRSLFEKTDAFKQIERIVVNMSPEPCYGIYIDDFGGYIDHQSCTTVSDFLNDFDLTLKEFIFGDNVELIIDNDNH